MTTRDLFDPARRGALKCLAFGAAGTLFTLSAGILTPVDLAFAKAGGNEAALPVIDQAIAIAEQTGERWCMAEILRIKAGLLSATDRASDQAEILLAKSLDIARGQRARCWELRAACDLALLWQRKDRAKEALLLLRPAYAQFTEGFASADLRHARLILDDLEMGLSRKQLKLKKSTIASQRAE